MREMGNELIGHEVKIVYQEQSSVRVLRGVLHQLDEQFAYLGRDSGDIMISTKTILQIKPEHGEKRNEHESRSK